MTLGIQILSNHSRLLDDIHRNASDTLHDYKAVSQFRHVLRKFIRYPFRGMCKMRIHVVAGACSVKIRRDRRRADSKGYNGRPLERYVSILTGP